MVAKTPLSREKRLPAALDPAIIRETIMKVDRCVARLQEMQFTVAGGRRFAGSTCVISPRRYLRTGLRLKNGTIQKSPQGKFPSATTGEWRRMSLPAMLLGETLLEIQQATRFAKIAAATVSAVDPKTPPVIRRTRATTRQETAELRSRRAREKQLIRRASHVECGSPLALPRARSRISFRPISPKGVGRDPYKHAIEAHRVSPKGSPWSMKKKKKTVMFPNATFNASPPPAQQRQRPEAVKRMMIPGIKRSPPHKFIIVKSPAGKPKIQTRMRSPPAASKSPQMKPMLASPARLLRRSFSPSKLASRLVSPIKSRLFASRRKSWVSTTASSGEWSGMAATMGAKLLPAITKTR